MFIIIGAGLFGSMTAKALAEDGHPVTVIDKDPANSCSVAAGCLIKPSWLNSMDPTKRHRGMSFLRANYPMRELAFRTIAGLHVSIDHLAPDHVLWPHRLVLEDEVMAIEQQGEQAAVSTARNGVLRGTVIVAAGVGCRDLIPGLKVRGLAGVSLLFRGEIDEPRLTVWSPYKQACAFGYNGSTWFGDGTAIKEENWGDDRVAKSIERAEALFGLTNPVMIRYGARPYIDGQNGYLERPTDHIWINTGGAKSGAVLAGAHADTIAAAYNPERMLV